MTDYEVLKAYGHSAALAATIVLDAQRGDQFSINWIKQARKSHEAGLRARQMNAELPEATRGVLKQKGMI